MYRIICDISGVVHEYADEGRWVQSGGLSFGSETEAQAKLDEDMWRISPRIRASVRIEGQ